MKNGQTVEKKKIYFHERGKNKKNKIKQKNVTKRKGKIDKTEI